MAAIRAAICCLISGLVLSAAQAAEGAKLDPDIAGIEETACLAKGGTFTLDGANFGPGTGLRLVAVDSPLSFVELPVRSWTDTKIVARIPEDSRIGEGRIYAIGIALAGANAILSNQVTAPVCAAPAAAAAPKPSEDKGFTLGLGLGFGLGGGRSSGGQAPSGGAPAPAPSQQMATPSYGTSAPAQPQPQPQQPRGTSSGGGGVGVGIGIGIPLGLPTGTAPPETPPAPAAAIPPVAPPATSIDIEPGEIVALFETAAAADAAVPQAAALGYAVKRREDLAGLALALIVFQVPIGTPVAAGVAALRLALPGVIVDANHRYALQEGGRYGLPLIGWKGAAGDCGANFRIGILDTGVDLGHPALSTRKIEAKTFVTMAAGETLAPPDHGTAVAAILVGDPASGDFTGVLPAAQLYSAAIFKISGLRGQATTTEAIMRGLSWMAGNKVTLVNMSFAGPRNAALDAVVHASLKSNVTIVAAAGNGGPSAPPAYPAAQEGVFAATAVDSSMGIYEWANRGGYVAFAGPGVDVYLAAPGGGGKIESGTSFAAPFVTAAFGEMLASGRPAGEVSQQLIGTVRDLGPPGRDETFGWGLVQLPATCGAP